jgi:hypothetical protein
VARLACADVLFRVRHFFLHLFAAVAMEGVALDVGGVDFLTAEDLLERAPDARRARSGRSRAADDGVLG